MTLNKAWCGHRGRSGNQRGFIGLIHEMNASTWFNCNFHDCAAFRVKQLASYTIFGRENLYCLLKDKLMKGCCEVVENASLIDLLLYNYKWKGKGYNVPLDNESWDGIKAFRFLILVFTILKIIPCVVCLFFKVTEREWHDFRFFLSYVVLYFMSKIQLQVYT